MTLLGHDLVFDSEDFLGVLGISYVCTICKCEIDYINSDNKYSIWYNGEYIKLIPCNEFIIKSLIE